MSRIADQETFYRERVPEQFNRTLAIQRDSCLTGEDASATRVLEEMEAVRASILVQVEDESSIHRHFFEIEHGEMSHVEKPVRSPFLILGHSLEDFENLHRECGDSLLGFLGGLAGLGDEMRLTSQRVRSLRDLGGSLVFERVGPGGFALHAHFGVEATTNEPRATIRLDEATYRQLRAGELDAQDAFLSGRVEILGDKGMAIELALAALSPD